MQAPHDGENGNRNYSNHLIIMQVQALESNLYSIQDEFEKLKDELKEATDQLSNCAEEKKSLEAQAEEGRRKYEQSCAQRKTLQVKSVGTAIISHSRTA
jgi:chromosome segregation ATPase